MLFEKRFVEKSCKINFAFAVISTISVIFVAFILVIFSTFVEFAIFENKSEIQTKIKSMNAKKNDEFNDILNENDEINEFIAKSTIQSRVKLTSLTKSSRMIQQFFHVIIFKRKRNIINEKKRNKHRSKVARVMMIFLFENLDTFDNEK